MFRTPKARRAALIGAGLAAAVLGSAGSARASHSGKADPAATSVSLDGRILETCKGQHIDEKAPVISTGDVLIRASVKTVFDLQTDIDNWATWRPDVVSATRLQPGPFIAGSSFRWETGGLTVVSTVRAVHHDHCTLRGGPASGIQGEHLWKYTEVPGGVLVHTEESWSGPPVDADVAGAQAALDSSLQAWRADLKRQAEAMTHQHD